MIVKEGCIKQGIYRNWKFVIEDDTEGETGGYYLLLQNNNQTQYDYWFEKYDYLKNQLQTLYIDIT